MRLTWTLAAFALLSLLSGGAHAQAHIGVLRYFEEHHIPIEYIAGMIPIGTRFFIHS